MKRLILEVSLKPFRDLSDAGIAATAREIVRQWGSLIRDAETLSFMLWTAEGSEILDYNGKAHWDDEIDWGRWIGIANGPWRKEPHQILHTWRWPYCEKPAVLTYERLATLVRIVKEEAGKATGKPVTIGTVFDPGPEFAESSFKYARHKEISSGATMGEGKWVNCTRPLSGDTRPYVGFPGGIPDGTPFGLFLGRQSQHFLTDLGFDYIWFSNGFAFALAAWNVTGEVFDGKHFDTTNAPRVRETILQFWKDFRKECPLFPIETRGSNLSTGMDLSAHASPVRDIYEGGFNLTAPVNSPWAALNGDYGLELIGWLSHIAELPENASGRSAVPFRFYIHDPWWANSPWLDRYGREPNDIYLPLSVCRIDGDGTVTRPGSVAMLTIDDSYGNMPEVVPNEVTPHVQQALRDFPDAPGLVTWIYPFDEYHEWTFAKDGRRVNEVFFGDWFLRAAVNQGFPLNTAVSTGNFAKAKAANPALFDGTLLVSPAPDAGSALAGLLVAHLEKGGSVLLYGPLRHADPLLLDLLGLKCGAPLSGVLDFHTTLPADSLGEGAFAGKLHLRALTSGGGAEELLPASAGSEVLAEVARDEERRAFSLLRALPGGGKLGWVRGALAEEIDPHQMLPVRDDAREWFSSERLMRSILEKFGTVLRFNKPSPETVDPLILAARCRNGWFFSGFSPSTNVQLRWRFPEGVPVPVGCDVLMEKNDGKGPNLGTLNPARAWHRECRVFVEQKEGGEVGCREKFQGAVDVRRRLLVTGLKDATVTFLHDTDLGTPVRFQEEQPYLGIGKEIPGTTAGHRTVAHHVTGPLLISW
ncbi:hypothetical protein SAMN05444156_1288 [Verrucomicrobium sp. GAS474]|uniref:hypothetical protein n=1 Tax=Verrucomicrobium sp. GAS474 TaxID=1882831 RepID=UPI00087BCFA5|nr:hypothetical protein [Verrucomicrobium sp. GAS474]SDT98989.1 hypothetical protein SAMN05444156_1288 [Verrucomicrobium sp. GAS474]